MGRTDKRSWIARLLGRTETETQALMDKNRMRLGLANKLLTELEKLADQAGAREGLKESLTELQTARDAYAQEISSATNLFTRNSRAAMHGAWSSFQEIHTRAHKTVLSEVQGRASFHALARQVERRIEEVQDDTLLFGLPGVQNLVETLRGDLGTQTGVLKNGSCILARDTLAQKLQGFDTACNEKRALARKALERNKKDENFIKAVNVVTSTIASLAELVDANTVETRFEKALQKLQVDDSRALTLVIRDLAELASEASLLFAERNAQKLSFETKRELASGQITALSLAFGPTEEITALHATLHQADSLAGGFDFVQGGQLLDGIVLQYDKLAQSAIDAKNAWDQAIAALDNSRRELGLLFDARPDPLVGDRLLEYDADFEKNVRTRAPTEWTYTAGLPALDPVRARLQKIRELFEERSTGELGGAMDRARGPFLQALKQATDALTALQKRLGFLPEGLSDAISAQKTEWNILCQRAKVASDFLPASAITARLEKLALDYNKLSTTTKESDLGDLKDKHALELARQGADEAFQAANTAVQALRTLAWTEYQQHSTSLALYQKNLQDASALAQITDTRSKLDILAEQARQLLTTRTNALTLAVKTLVLAQKTRAKEASTLASMASKFSPALGLLAQGFVKETTEILAVVENVKDYDMVQIATETLDTLKTRMDRFRDELTQCKSGTGPLKEMNDKFIALKAITEKTQLKEIMPQRVQDRVTRLNAIMEKADPGAPALTVKALLALEADLTKDELLLTELLLVRQNGEARAKEVETAIRELGKISSAFETYVEDVKSRIKTLRAHLKKEGGEKAGLAGLDALLLEVREANDQPEKLTDLQAQVIRRSAQTETVKAEFYADLAAVEKKELPALKKAIEKAKGDPALSKAMENTLSTAKELAKDGLYESARETLAQVRKLMDQVASDPQLGATTGRGKLLEVRKRWKAAVRLYGESLKELQKEIETQAPTEMQDQVQAITASLTKAGRLFDANLFDKPIAFLTNKKNTDKRARREQRDIGLLAVRRYRRAIEKDPIFFALADSPFKAKARLSQVRGALQDLQLNLLRTA